MLLGVKTLSIVRVKGPQEWSGDDDLMCDQGKGAFGAVQVNPICVIRRYGLICRQGESVLYIVEENPYILSGENGLMCWQGEAPYLLSGEKGLMCCQRFS